MVTTCMCSLVDDLLSYCQVEHFDDMRRSLEGYKDIANATVPGQLYPYLLKLYRKIIEGSLMKHSKRASSEEVCIDHLSYHD